MNFRTESGAILPLFGIILLPILIVLGFSVDQSRSMVAHRKAEALADALALAGVQTLDRSIIGWQNSKRLMLRTLQQSHFPEISSTDLRNIAGFDPGSDPFDSGLFSGSRITIGNDLTVEIERGYYEDGVGFTSLEGLPTMHSVPSYHMANAVNVEVVRSKIANPIAGMFQSSQDIKAEAFAVRDRGNKVPVAPIAIPACYLFSDTNPYSDLRYDTAAFSAGNLDTGKQCAREVVARGLGVHESTDIQIQDGILRSDVIPRPPLFPYDDSVVGMPIVGRNTTVENFCFTNPVSGLHENCKAPPIRAFLGMPGATFDAIDDLDTLITAFADSSHGELQASVGTPFQGADSSFYLDKRFEDLLRELLQGTPSLPPSAPVGVSSIGTGNLRPFREVFYQADPNSGFEIPGLNFPARRNIVSVQPDENGAPSPYSDPFAELRLSWPVSDPSAPNGREAILLEPGMDTINPLYPASGNYHFRYTNPMCHTEGVPHDDDLVSYAREINIMVISPRDESTPYQYCDINSLYTQTEQNAVPPLPISEPVVVGFVKAYFFDFRVTPFSGSMSPTPTFPKDIRSSAASGVTDLVDKNPFAYDVLYDVASLKQYFQDASQYIIDQSEYIKCQSCLQSSTQLSMLPAMCDPYKNTVSGAIDCSTFPQSSNPPPNIFTDPSGVMRSLPPWVKQCFSAPSQLGDLVGQLGAVSPFVPNSVTTIDRSGSSITSAECADVDPHSYNTTGQFSKLPSFNKNQFGNTVRQACVPSCLEVCGGKNPLSDPNLFSGSSSIPDQSISSYIAHLQSEVTRLQSDVAKIISQNGDPSAKEAELLARSTELNLYSKYDAGQHWSQNMGGTIEEVCAYTMYNEVDPDHKICGMDFIHRSTQAGTIKVMSPVIAIDSIDSQLLDSIITDSGSIIPGTTNCGKHSCTHLVQSSIPVVTQFCDNLCQGSSAGSLNRCIDVCSIGYKVAAMNGKVSLSQMLIDRLNAIDQIRTSADEIFTQLMQRYGSSNHMSPTSPGLDLMTQMAMAAAGAVDGLHCLPKKVDDQWDVRDPNSWEQPKPRAPGYGCAGLRLRLDCNQTRLVPPQYIVKTRPRIVQ